MALKSDRGSTSTAVLRDRTSRLFLTVTLVAGFGSTAMSLVASVWVLSLTGSASLAAITGLGIYIPSLLGPIIGTVVDRVPRLRLLAWTCAAMALLLLTLVAVTGRGGVWLILLVMCGYGVSLVLIDAAESAIVQATVPDALRGGLNSLRMSVQEGMKLVAPPAGAALFTVYGGRSVALVSAAALVTAALLYRQLPVRAEDFDRPRRGGLWREAAQGVAHIVREPQLRSVVVIASAAVGGSGLAVAAGFIVITDDLHRAPAFAGVLAAAQGAGSILSGLICASLLRRTSERAVAVAGGLLSATGFLLVAVGWLPSVVLGRVLVGVGLPWTVIAAFTAIQRLTSDALIGRVAASASTLIFAPVAATTAIGAGLVALVDHRVPQLAAAAVTAVAAGLVLVRRERLVTEHS